MKNNRITILYALFVGIYAAYFSGAFVFFL